MVSVYVLKNKGKFVSRSGAYTRKFERARLYGTREDAREDARYADVRDGNGVERVYRVHLPAPVQFERVR